MNMKIDAAFTAEYEEVVAKIARKIANGNLDADMIAATIESLEIAVRLGSADTGTLATLRAYRNAQ